MLDWLENVGALMAEAPRAWLAAGLGGAALAAVSRRRTGPLAMGLLVLAVVAGIAEWLWQDGGNAPPLAKALAGAFASIALGAAATMAATRNPVYAALVFAVAVLGVCGLFLMLGAPFLAAATAIVYGGAIVVTFLFVIMLAQMKELAAYDRHAWNPQSAAAAAAVFAGVALTVAQTGFPRPSPIAPERAGLAASLVVRSKDGGAWREQRSPLSAPSPADRSSLQALGRTLWGDYLLGVEICGTLLLVAAIGAIAVNQAPREARS